MAANLGAMPMQVKTTHGWRMGLSTMLGKELGEWFKTKTWLVQAIIWTLLANGFVAMILFDGRVAGGDDVRTITTMMFFLFGGMGAAVGACIAMQDAIIGEKQSGTAAWVLSKPLSRASFIISKLAANALGFLLTAVVIPGAVFYGLFYVAEGIAWPIANLAGALALAYLNLLFWMMLTLMLGTLFNSRGPVIGIPLGLLFGYQGVVQVAPFLKDIMPYQLVTPLGQQASLPMAGMLLHGQALTTTTPIVGSMAAIVVFVLIALWRFEGEEF